MHKPFSECDTDEAVLRVYAGYRPSINADCATYAQYEQLERDVQYYEQIVSYLCYRFLDSKGLPTILPRSK